MIYFNKITRLLSGTLLLSFFSSIAASQGTMLLRQPTLSKQHIVFVHGDDLWVVAREGGDARRLTTAVGAETSPKLSADGKWVAFTGQYDGNTDVYIVSVDGGEPKRLTWHPSPDVVQGWTSDGKSVYFTSPRETTPIANTKFFKVNVEGGTPEAFIIPFGSSGSFSEDGQHMAYQPYQFWDPEWRNYRGGQAQPIWIFNMKTQETIKTPRSDNERHTSPAWDNGILFFLSELDFANNVWSYNPQTKALKQLTFHKDFDVKNLAASNGQLVYEQSGQLHSLDLASGKTKLLEINMKGGS
jgi:tricorn protease